MIKAVNILKVGLVIKIDREWVYKSREKRPRIPGVGFLEPINLHAGVHLAYAKICEMKVLDRKWPNG